MNKRGVSRQYRWKVQARLAVLEYATARGLKPAAARFGLDRKTVREWRDRARTAGVAGLVPRYPARRPRRIPETTVALIEQARREFGWGACRTRLWLLRVHQIKVAAKTIVRICEDLGLPRAQGAKPRRAPRQLKLFEKATPGESVQVDVKVVAVGGTKAYQYTACDDCTRYRVLRLFPRLDTRTSLDFLAELRRVLPFPIQKCRRITGRSSPSASSWPSSRAGCVTGTSSRGDRSRTARSSAAIGSTTRSSGAARRSPPSPTRRPRSAGGSTATTGSASPWPSTGGHPPRSCQPSHSPLRTHSPHALSGSPS